MKKLLIVYSSKYGFTLEVINKIKRLLNMEVDVFNVSDKEVPNIENYDTVIIGSSLYFGKIRKDMRIFMNKYKDILLSKRIAIFLCGAQRDAVLNVFENSFPTEVNAKASVKELVGYGVKYKKLNLIDKLIWKTVKGSTDDELNFYDDRIELFVNSISKF